MSKDIYYLPFARQPLPVKLTLLLAISAGLKAVHSPRDTAISVATSSPIVAGSKKSMSRIPDVAHVIEIRSDTTTEYRVYTGSREVSGVALSQVSIIRQGHFW